MSRKQLRRIAWVGVFLGISLLAIDAIAGRGGRGGGGRGNISRGGPAMGGSMRHSGVSSRGGFGGYSRGSRDSYGSRTRPSTGSPTRPSQGDRRPAQGGWQDGQNTRPNDRPGDRNDRFDERQDNRNDRFDERQDNRNDRFDDRMDNRKDARHEYQEHHEHHYGYSEFYEDRWKYAVGASLTAMAFRSLTCTPTTVIVNGVSYYQCGPTWYQRAYSGGSTTYVVINAPPGY